MKKFSLVIFILLNSLTVLKCQSVIQVTWGIENKNYYKENNVLIQRELGWDNVSNKINGKTLRYIEPTSNFSTQLKKSLERHDPVWRRYLQSLESEEKPDRKKFMGFAKEADPYYIGLVSELAPVLYFDFIGESKEYVLTSIDVETIWYGEVEAGGFLCDNAWFDIVLTPKKGLYKKKIEDGKLKFFGSGRAELIFWSDRFSESMGLTIPGTYILNIIFHFLSDGENVSVMTIPFAIDV